MGADSNLVLYGNSVILAAIGTELHSHCRFDVIALEPGCPDALPRICALNPRAVLFDLATLPPDSMISLLREQPGLLLAGVDPSSDQVLVLSCRQERAMAPADLLEVIERETQHRVAKEAMPKPPEPGRVRAGQGRRPIDKQKGKKGVSLR